MNSLLNRQKKGLLFGGLFLALGVSSCFFLPTLAQEVTQPVKREARWATPLKLKGVPNLYKINDQLYRSAQPTAEGMRNLKKMGIKTVINLRAFHTDHWKVSGTGLLNEELSVKTWHIEDEDVVQVLQIVAKAEKGPFLIHCQHGADRTGLMSAMYRIVVQGWSRREAIDEMMNGGFGFHTIWTNIPDYLENVDIARIRRDVSKE